MLRRVLTGFITCKMCNRAGIDTISTGATVAYAIECFENGLIDSETTGGLKLTWGNKNALTDGAMAALTARTAILGALYNVKVNLNFIEDHQFLKEVTKEVKSIENRVVRKEKEILSHVDI